MSEIGYCNPQTYLTPVGQAINIFLSSLETADVARLIISLIRPLFMCVCLWNSVIGVVVQTSPQAIVTWC